MGRHGNVAPKGALKQMGAGQPLPGAINIGFFDTHVELIKLDRLWDFYWHRNYVPPTRRPS